MALVIVGSLVTACLLLFQGLHVIRDGNMRPFFQGPRKSRDSGPSLKRRARRAAALLYLITSGSIFCILVIALFRGDGPRLFAWLTDRGVELVGGVFLLSYGLVALVRPQIVLRWVGMAYQDPPLGVRGPSAQNFVRVLGGIVSAFGLLIFRNL